MIQFNLLPDIKLQYVKARRLKRLVTLISIGVSGASLFVLILSLLTVDVVQRKNLNDLNRDIKKYSAQIKQVSDLDRILTVQNQLDTLTGLHDDKVVSSRLFTYMSQVTPTTAGIGKLDVDFAANTMSIGGTSPSLDSVNVFVDTLKRTTYTTAKDPGTKTPAFSDVVMSFTRDSKSATFTINLNFDSTIFNSSDDINLVVPSGVGGVQLFGAGN